MSKTLKNKALMAFANASKKKTVRVNKTFRFEKELFSEFQKICDKEKKSITSAFEEYMKIVVNS